MSYRDIACRDRARKGRFVADGRAYADTNYPELQVEVVVNGNIPSGTAIKPAFGWK